MLALGEGGGDRQFPRNQNWSGKSVNSRKLLNNNSDIFPQATYWLLPHPSLFPWHFCCGTKLDCFLDGQKWHGQQNGSWHHHYLDYNVPSWISEWFHAPSKLPKGFRLVFTGVVHTDVLITGGMHDSVCCLPEWKQSKRWPGLLNYFCAFVFLRPRPYVSVFVWKRRFPRPHLVLFNHFCPSTRKPNSDWKWYQLWWEDAHSLVTSVSLIQTSTGKHRFQDIHTVGRFFKRCVYFFSIYTGNVWMVGQAGGKKSPFSTKTDACRRCDVKKRPLNG